MSLRNRFSRLHSYFLPLLGIRGLVTIVVVLSFAAPCCFAQSSTTPASNSNKADNQTTPSGPASTVTISGGTRLALVLTSPVRSKGVHRGDEIYAQITSPVISGDQAVIPAGAFIQGKVHSLERRGTRGELTLDSMSIVFPDSYVAMVPGRLTVETAEGYAAIDVSNGRAAGAFLLPLAGAGLGALIGHSTGSSGSGTNSAVLPPGCTAPACSPLTLPTLSSGNQLEHTAIGSVVGAAAGGIASLVLIARSHGFALDAGTPMSVTLPNAVSLQEGHALSGLPAAGVVPVRPLPHPPIQVGPENSPGNCRTGQDWCGGTCVDTISFMNDSFNCGRCGNRCGFSEACTGGFCGCAAGYTSCMGSCMSDASFISDSSNCGRCGNHCSMDERCVGGSCMKNNP
jgi:hypothetical protein